MGSRRRRRSPNATAVVLQPFPAAAAEHGPARAQAGEASTGSVAIPPDGAVLVASGAEARELANEAPAGTQVTARLILPSAWSGTDGRTRRRPAARPQPQGGLQDERELRVRPAGVARRPARASASSTTAASSSSRSTARRPGYSVGMTAYELAQTMVRLGAVTAAAVEPGKPVTAAFQGQVLNRPSGRAGEVPVKEALLVQYAGVYVPAPTVAHVGSNNRAAARRSSPMRSSGRRP